MEGQHWLYNPRRVTVKERFCGLNVELPAVWNASIFLAEGICYSCGCSADAELDSSSDAEVIQTSVAVDN